MAPTPALTLTLLAGPIAVCRLPADAETPGWASTRPFVSITRTADELSIVCAEDDVPTDEEIKVERGWRVFKFDGPFAFNLTGILVSVLQPLADAKIGIFAISTFDTDYVLVKADDLAQAINALRLAGHHVFG
jgi:uncharacterized protein